MVVMLDCGGGGSILASEGLLTVRGAIDQSWRALECIRANGLDKGANLLRVTNRAAGMPNHVERGETRRGGW